MVYKMNQAANKKMMSYHLFGSYQQVTLPRFGTVPQPPPEKKDVRR